MDVDGDINSLMRNFSCLGTNDKEVLINQFQNLVGNVISLETANFYLEMADWNVQAAVCSYFDLQKQSMLPQMVFVKDVTLGEGESIPPNTRFTKIWRMKNSGDEPWPINCRLLLVVNGGIGCECPQSVEIRSICPGEEIDVAIDMISPSGVGHICCRFRMITNQGFCFGDHIWAICNVEDSGTMGVVQQMDKLRVLGEQNFSNNCNINPFSTNSSVNSVDSINTNTINFNGDPNMS